MRYKTHRKATCYRQNKRRRGEEIRLLSQYKELVQLLEKLNHQLATQVTEQQKLLEEQRHFLRLLLRWKDRG